eukprot:5952477-Ditylum_brightwellii.AAC.1
MSKNCLALCESAGPSCAYIFEVCSQSTRDSERPATQFLRVKGLKLWFLPLLVKQKRAQRLFAPSAFSLQP